MMMPTCHNRHFQLRCSMSIFRPSVSKDQPFVSRFSGRQVSVRGIIHKEMPFPDERVLCVKRLHRKSELNDGPLTYFDFPTAAPPNSKKMNLRNPRRH